MDDACFMQILERLLQLGQVYLEDAVIPWNAHQIPVEPGEHERVVVQTTSFGQACPTYITATGRQDDFL